MLLRFVPQVRNARNAPIFRLRHASESRRRRRRWPHMCRLSVRTERRRLKRLPVRHSRTPLKAGSGRRRTDMTRNQIIRNRRTLRRRVHASAPSAARRRRRRRRRLRLHVCRIIRHMIRSRSRSGARRWMKTRRTISCRRRGHDPVESPYLILRLVVLLLLLLLMMMMITHCRVHVMERRLGDGRWRWWRRRRSPSRLLQRRHLMGERLVAGHRRVG